MSFPIKLWDQNFSIGLCNQDVVSAKTVGEVRLHFSKNRYLVVLDVYFIFGITRNLIFIDKLHE